MDERKFLFCNGIEDEIHFLFYCKLYQNTQEYRDFVLEFGVNKFEFKALLTEDKKMEKGMANG